MVGGMEAVLDSVRQTIARWINTNVPLTADANPGDTIIQVKNTNRFYEDSEILIFTQDPTTGWQAEMPIIVTQVIDQTHLRLSAPIKYVWTVANKAMVQKTFSGQLLQGIYVGNPDNIPRYPAITVEGKSLASEWFTLQSTKETFNIEVTIYTQASYQEAGYRALMKLTDAVVFGLKRNIYPLINPYRAYAILADINGTDQFIKVSDTSWFSQINEFQRVVIEDQWKQSEITVRNVIDATTLQIDPTTGCDFVMADDPMLITVPRFIFNSWTPNVSYGDIYRGTLLKAAKITWFAWENKIQTEHPRDTYLH